MAFLRSDINVIETLLFDFCHGVELTLIGFFIVAPFTTKKLDPCAVAAGGIARATVLTPCR
jgi:hypothetical protein